MLEKDVKDILKSSRIEAAELFSAAVCNLDCSYCYIPKKDPRLSTYHKNILNKINSDVFIKELAEMYGENLTSLSHWGTEPTLTLKYFTQSKFYEKLQPLCPNLVHIQMSSNFMFDPYAIPEFIKSLPKYKKNLKVGIQISLDGPDYITDKNRGHSSAQTIIKNSLTCFSILKDMENEIIEKNISITAHMKPTHFVDEIKLLMDMKYVIEYCEYFDKYMEQLLRYRGPAIEISNSCEPTLVYPGRYTVEDGKNYSKYVENFFKIFMDGTPYRYASFYPPYLTYFRNLLKHIDHGFTGHAQTACSAGRSQLAITDKDDLIFCHRMFYMNDPKAYDEMFGKFLDNNACFSGSEFNRDDLLKKFVAKNSMELANALYVSRGFNDYHGHKHNCAYSIVKELARAGQISKIYYENDNYCMMFIEFVLQRACPVENIVTTGSLHLTPTSFYRIYGNGMFEQIYNHTFKGKI